MKSKKRILITIADKINSNKNYFGIPFVILKVQYKKEVKTIKVDEYNWNFKGDEIVDWIVNNCEIVKNEK